jgi:hypothetical protein
VADDQQLARCDSCGRDEPVADVVAVHRVYVTPAERGFEDLTEPRIQVVDEVEGWCFPCRASYPHQVDGDEAFELGPGRSEPTS